jgi:hypothetical protein
MSCFDEKSKTIMDNVSLISNTINHEIWSIP